MKRKKEGKKEGRKEGRKDRSVTGVSINGQGWNEIKKFVINGKCQQRKYSKEIQTRERTDRGEEK